MNGLILKELFSKGWIDSGVIKRLGIASYTYQKTLKDLYWFGVIVRENSKTSVLLTDNPVSVAFKKLFFEGFKVELLSKENVSWLLSLIEPVTTAELAELTGFSIAQSNHKINQFSQFLTKKDGKYFLASSYKYLYDFLLLLRKKNAGTYLWNRNGEKLQKIPLDFPVDGVLTGFSRFSEFGFSVNPSHNYVFKPWKELSLEEILAHAIKFSANANDLTLCTLFYLKNRAKFNVSELEKNCEKLGVIKLWFDLVAYIYGLPVKNPELFLSKQEFYQKARMYEIKLASMYGLETIQKIFKEASQKVSKKIKVYFIGGNALIEHKTKNSTKDIDLVVVLEEQAKILINAFKKLGFSEVAEREFQYGLLEASAMLQRQNSPRIDLFVRKICGVLEFSKNMQKRSKKIVDDNIQVFLASLEDIFLLKSISSRDSDLIDCETIMQTNVLNWKTIYSEIILQEKNLKGLKELLILDHLEALETRMNIRIPITKKLTNHCMEKSILFLAKKPVSVQEIRKEINFSETTIRNKIVQLLKKNKVKKISEHPLKIKLTN
ncbi:MAG: DUF6036 family nucleotidyltransferase [archaeon]